MSTPLQAFLGSLAAGLATSLGALGIFGIRSFSARVQSTLLSLAAGVMLAASMFSLILPALDLSGELWNNSLISVGVVSLGIVLGALFVWVLHENIPHEHFARGREGKPLANSDSARKLKRTWLFIATITIHNFPEGMAVGTGFGAGELSKGISLATGIGLQNIPEGLAVAGALMSTGSTRMRAFLIATLTGLVEPIGGLFGGLAVSIATQITPLAMGFSAGAMLFIIASEIIPETHETDAKERATFTLLCGFLVMMALDYTLG